jgi:hypothetical protein
MKPKDIAPSIFAISLRKNITVNKGLLQDFWIVKLNTRDRISLNQVSKFVDLSTKINEVQLVEGTPDDITWKFTNSGSYTMAPAYKAQFEGIIDSFMIDAVWKNWAPPKHKLFAWHILHNRVWSADRLHNHGWPNYGNCQLCKREPKTMAHLFIKCRYTIRVWNSLISWLRIDSVDTILGQTLTPLRIGG